MLNKMRWVGQAWINFDNPASRLYGGSNSDWPTAVSNYNAATWDDSFYSNRDVSRHFQDIFGSVRRVWTQRNKCRYKIQHRPATYDIYLYSFNYTAGGDFPGYQVNSQEYIWNFFNSNTTEQAASETVQHDSKWTWEEVDPVKIDKDYYYQKHGPPLVVLKYNYDYKDW
jgi:hypothetical protein